MANLNDAPAVSAEGLATVRLGEDAGSEHLGASLYELQPGQGMVFHYHLQREELLVVISGTLALRTASGWRDLAEGDVIAFPQGETRCSRLREPQRCHYSGSDDQRAECSERQRLP